MFVRKGRFGKYGDVWVFLWVKVCSVCVSVWETVGGKGKLYVVFYGFGVT